MSAAFVTIERNPDSGVAISATHCETASDALALAAQHNAMRRAVGYSSSMGAYVVEGNALIALDPDWRDATIVRDDLAFVGVAL